MEAVVAAIGIIMTIVDHMAEMAVVTAATVSTFSITLLCISPTVFIKLKFKSKYILYYKVEDRLMIVAVAGAAAMAETVMADEMVLHNLIPVGKNPTAMVAVSSMKVKQYF